MNLGSALGRCGFVEVGCLAFVSLMFLLFPIFFINNFYFNLNIAKFWFFIGCEMFLVVWTLFGYFRRENQGKIKQNFKVLKSDFAVVGLLLISLISGFFSECFPHTFFGVIHRYNGLFIIILYSVMYFIMTRFLEHCFKEIFLLLAISSFCAYLLGALNCFGIDPLGAFNAVSCEQKGVFISTIGNRNFFSTFVCISLPVFLVMFCKLKSRIYVAIYAVVAAFGCFALYCSNTDSGFLGVFLAFAVLSLFSIENLSCFRRYMICVFMMVCCGMIFCHISRLVWGPGAIYSHILRRLNDHFILIFIATFIFTLIMLTFVRPFSKIIENNIKRIRFAIFFGYIFLIAVLIFLFVYYSFISNDSCQDGFRKYFRFSESWGSNRGVAWISLIFAMFKFNFFQIFFGFGPDTVSFIFSKYYSEQIQSGQLPKFDSAHNEYLQYLVTDGVLGLLMYIFLVGTVLYYGFKMACRSEAALACVLSALCYCVQGIFNISMISTTPLFFLMLTLIVAEYRNSPKGSAQTLPPKSILEK